MSNERVAELMKQIRTALINKKIAYREAFSRFDENKDGFLSFGEFSKGIDQVLTLSVPIKEKLFALMDVNKIGLIDYPNFLEFIQKTSLTVKKFNFEDNFDWENNVIVTIKAWIQNERITVEEGFKCFDKDFDGFISKDDLKYALIEILKIKPETIVPTKLDRLFRLMDFYKTNSIQLSDF
jgi:Ca2+-binding EF-hand superfamily protein